MISFFGRNRSADFVMFSASHGAAVLALIVCCLALFACRHRLRSSPAAARAFRLLLAAVLLGSELCLQLWYVSQDIWKPRHSLPLELCGITLLLSAVLLLTRSRLLYSFLFFAGIGGALVAFATPNLVYPFPHFRFLQFFIAHTAIILTPLYMTWVEGYRPTWKSVGFTMLCLNGLAAVVWMINRELGSNYMFLNRKPDTYSVLNHFGPYPNYLLAEEVLAFGLFSFMYAAFFLLPERIRASRRR